MKIRNGFVSNSSSSSFLILSKNDPKIPKKKRKYGNYINVRVVEEQYNRGRNEIVKTIEDKLRLVTAFYAMSFNDWRNFDEDLYITKMTAFRRKVRELGKKYDYQISLTVPPIFFYDDTEDPTSQTTISKEVEVATEWWEGVDIIKDIVENDDTTRLERLLFNDESFFIVGGDEFEENFKLQCQMKQHMTKHPFEHEFFGTDDEECFGVWDPDDVDNPTDEDPPSDDIYDDED